MSKAHNYAIAFAIGVLASLVVTYASNKATPGSAVAKITGRG